MDASLFFIRSGFRPLGLAFIYALKNDDPLFGGGLRLVLNFQAGWRFTVAPV